MRTNIHDTLDSLSVGPAVQYGPMTMYPLLLQGVQAPRPNIEYVSLEEALRTEKVIIQEVSAGGSVPELLFQNHSDWNVLLVEGDHLVGAKQNRTLNTTILAPAHEELIIPVSCVEQGRWSHRSSKFSYSDAFQFSKGRRGKVDSVSDSMKYSHHRGRVDRSSDQAEVWSAIELKQRKLKSHSRTSAMDDLYQSSHDQLESYLYHFSYQEEQVGVVFIIADEVAGTDYFESPEMMRRYLPKLVRSYAMDAIELGDDTEKSAKVDDAISLLKDVMDCEVKLFDSVGKGMDARLDGSRVTGGGLIVDDRLLHLSAFRKQPASRNFH